MDVDVVAAYADSTVTFMMSNNGTITSEARECDPCMALDVHLVCWQDKHPGTPWPFARAVAPSALPSLRLIPSQQNTSLLTCPGCLLVSSVTAHISDSRLPGPMPGLQLSSLPGSALLSLVS